MVVDTVLLVLMLTGLRRDAHEASMLTELRRGAHEAPVGAWHLLYHQVTPTPITTAYLRH